MTQASQFPNRNGNLGNSCITTERGKASSRNGMSLCSLESVGRISGELAWPWGYPATHETNNFSLWTLDYWFTQPADYCRSEGGQGCGSLTKCELVIIKATFLPPPTMTPPRKSFPMTSPSAVYICMLSCRGKGSLAKAYEYHTLGEKYKPTQKKSLQMHVSPRMSL